MTLIADMTVFRLLIVLAQLGLVQVVERGNIAVGSVRGSCRISLQLRCSRRSWWVGHLNRKRLLLLHLLRDVMIRDLWLLWRRHHHRWCGRRRRRTLSKLRMSCSEYWVTIAIGTTSCCCCRGVMGIGLLHMVLLGIGREIRCWLDRSRSEMRSSVVVHHLLLQLMLIRWIAQASRVARMVNHRLRIPRLSNKQALRFVPQSCQGF